MNRLLVLLFLLVGVGFAADTSYTVVVTTNPAGAGRVYGGSNYLKGSQVPLVAVPGTDYVFANWTENGVPVNSSQSCYIISLTKNRNFVANFSKSTPVKLVSFSGSANRGKVTLSWRTATEINNYGFFVERSASGGVYKVIGNVIPGYGTSYIYHNYSFTDQPGAGKFFYRLRQMDNDGNISYPGKPVYISVYTVMQLSEK